jgi:hypothetical protein
LRVILRVTLGVPGRRAAVLATIPIVGRREFESADQSA